MTVHIRPDGYAIKVERVHLLRGHCVVGLLVGLCCGPVGHREAGVAVQDVFGLLLLGLVARRLTRVVLTLAHRHNPRLGLGGAAFHRASARAAGAGERSTES